MSTTEMASQTSSDDTSIRPVHVGFPDADVEDLRRRVEATRWPERETVGDDSQGVRLELIQELAHFTGEMRAAFRWLR